MGSSTIVSDYIAGFDPRHPLISPLYADLSRLPPLLLHVGEHELLLDDVVRFGDRALASGIKVKTVVWPQMFHVFQTFAPILPEARLANDQIVKFVLAQLSLD
jgi:acetyl esterase/lipase